MHVHRYIYIDIDIHMHSDGYFQVLLNPMYACSYVSLNPS